ncbi:MAG TPA: Glu/Leu/Phe/Val dehydrogenase dimerization domain-containing protein, partial [Gemmatimonadales bacterium]|nr:Glu/Leu/Phe/Val dehydrogenase dimerization domain-containing protein [Gemmatimonadales bacterium]
MLERLAEQGHEQVSFFQDRAAGYQGIIAIHSTVLGPSLGGTRFWAYGSEADALADVLRLSRAMTYKAATAGLDLGGGKSVILGDNTRRTREPLFRAHGRHVHALSGRYITAEDVGTSPEDMAFIRAETPYVVGLESGSGDPSPLTAFGVYRGMKACARHRWGNDALEGRTVAVQGVGHVGYYLCRDLHAEGARLVVTDVAPEKVRRVVTEFGARGVAPEEITGVRADVFAPCALGGAINDASLKRLSVEIVAGGANNQLAEPRHGDLLEERGITYAPDYVINGGGLMNVGAELAGKDRSWARAKASAIYDTVLHVL